MRNSLLLAAVLALLPVTGWALEVTQNDVNLRVVYTEPTVTQKGAPLDDLAYTTITVMDGTVILAEMDIPAMALTGGGTITQDILFTPIPGEKKTYTVNVTASDTNIDPKPNESLPATASVLVDREAPGVPQ